MARFGGGSGDLVAAALVVVALISGLTFFIATDSSRPHGGDPTAAPTSTTTTTQTPPSTPPIGSPTSPPPDAYKVPDLVGKSRADAEAVLGNVPFTVSLQETDRPNIDKVVEQKPTPGELLGPGSIELVVGKLRPGPDFKLTSTPRCSIVPKGSLSGADNLTIFVALINTGSSYEARLVPYRMSSDTGLASQGNTSISSGSSFTAMQVDLHARDYNRQHKFTIVADPDNSIPEEDESNNSLAVLVILPSQPQSTRDVPCSLA